MAQQSCLPLIHQVRFNPNAETYRRLTRLASRFLIVVLSAYKQIRAQSTNVLLDIEERNFDKAFAFLRPGKEHPFWQCRHVSHLF